MKTISDNRSIQRVKMRKSNVLIGSNERVPAPESTNRYVLKELALQHLTNQRYVDAGKTLEQLTKLEPQNAQVLNQLGIVYENLQRYDLAINNYKASLDANPKCADAYANLIDLYTQQRRFDAAWETAQDALYHCADAAHVWNSVGKLAAMQGDYRAAIKAFKNAIQGENASGQSWSNLGAVYTLIEDFTRAKSCLERALTLSPNNSNALNNLALALTELGDYNDASRCFEIIYKHGGIALNTLNNVGIYHQRQGQYAQALVIQDKAVSLAPHDAQTRWLRGLTLLTLGRYGEGWDDYEYGLKVAGKRQPESFGKPIWNGVSLSDQTLLISQEQGIGDQLLFLSCLPDAIRAAKTVYLNCNERLEPLIRQNFSSVIIFQRDQLDQIDFVLPMGSLPKFFRREKKHFPPRPDKLLANVILKNKWLKRFQSLPQGLKIGISWRGGASAEKFRKSTQLEEWLPLLKLGNAQFINLQYDAKTEEINRFNENHHCHIHHWDEFNPMQNMEDFFAQLAALDLVISVSNATVHAAGSLGIPSFLLIPTVSNWRWELTAKRSIWYPSVEIFRALPGGAWPEWSQVLKKISDIVQTD